jgi:hypothetical protein
MQFAISGSCFRTRGIISTKGTKAFSQALYAISAINMMTAPTIYSPRILHYTFNDIIFVLIL